MKFIEYSRDWAAKGTLLLGVRVVIAESYERIHRSNLIGMGVLPLEFPANVNRKTLKLTGDEIINIAGLQTITPGEMIIYSTYFNMHPPTQQKTRIVSPFLGLAVHLEVY